MTHTITLLPGDGIGPEVTDATIRVLEATGVAIDWERFDRVGESAVEHYGTPLPDEILDSIRRNRVALKGPVTTPVGTGFRSVNVSLRQKLDLYANVRPCRTLPGLDDRYKDVELVIFRENTEGLYSGIENYDERLEIIDTIARITRAGSERIVRFAFEYAHSHNRRLITVVHKANILKGAGKLFLDIASECSRDYPAIELNDRIIDNMCMQLVINPTQFDCIVTTNLFGDILSDLAAGLVGGLGVVAGANVGDNCAVFEAVHGSAPDIAGRGLANPTALIRSSEMMLRHLGEASAARALQVALHEAYRDATVLTGDVGGTASTMQFADDIARRVAAAI